MLLLGAVVAAAAAAAAVVAQPSGLEEKGAVTFREEGCYGCHTIGKFGTPIGPDLSYVGTKFSRDYLRRWLADPEAQRPNAHMPKLELTPEQINALAAFLATRTRR